MKVAFWYWMYRILDVPANWARWHWLVVLDDSDISSKGK